jgi:tripartite-type tricarboxylate transporter receptor subunit TctC
MMSKPVRFLKQHRWLLFFYCIFTNYSFAEFPDKPIHIVVPFTAGGNVDISARTISQSLQEKLNQAIVVDNKPGANAMIGADYVAHAKPDGYTLLLGTAETLAINPHFYAKINYDPLKDFTTVGLIGDFPFALVISPNLNIHNVAEFVAEAQKNPRKYNFSSWGIGSTSQIAFELFKNVASIDLVHVPFPGASPAITAVSAGEVQAMMVPLSVAIPQAKNGRVVILGITSKKRVPQAPEIPTFIEQNFPVELSGWHILVAPKSTPSKIIEKLHQALIDSFIQTSTKQNLDRIGINASPMSTQEAQTFFEKEYVRWGTILKNAKITESQ